MYLFNSTKKYVKPRKTRSGNYANRRSSELGVGSWESGVRCWMLDGGYQMSDVRCQMSDVRCQMSDQFNREN